MAPNFTLQFGGVDLSQYVRVGPQDGLDIYGGSFEDPVFSQSAIGDGQPLVGVDVKNREMVWPLFLKAASKDALNALKVQIMREVRYGAKPLRVKWQDANATNPTFYDIAFARLDEKLNYRLEEHNWADAGFHIWLQPPYGHTGTERVVATLGAGSGPIAQVFPGTVLGDVDAQLVLDTSFAKAGYVAMSVAASSFVPFYGASQLQSSTASRRASATSAYGVEFYNGAAGDLNVRRDILPSSKAPLLGRNRVLAMVRSVGTYAGWYAIFENGDANPDTFSATVMATGAVGAWATIDLGVWDVPTLAGASIAVQLIGARQGGVGSQELGCAGIFLFPEENTTIVSGGAHASGAVTIDAVNDLITQSYRVLKSGTVRTFYTDSTGDAIGRVPDLQTASPMQVMVALLPAGTGDISNGLGPVTVKVRERFTFAR